THLPLGGLYSVNERAVETGWNPAWNAHVPQSKPAWDTVLACPGATWTPTRGPNEYRPIVCVDWYQAYAFCIWDGGFLPSYAEWNYAATGGGDQFTFPWGDGPVPDPDHAQYCSLTACPIMSANVGSFPLGNGRYGQADLAGNAWERVADGFPPATDDVCDDCV